MRRAAFLVILVMILPAWMALPTAGAATGQIDIVGYAPNDARASQLAIQAAGGRILRSSAELGFSVVQTDDPATFERAMSLSPTIQYTERDDPTRITAGQWNGAQWNAAQWNGAQWNGAQWNSAQWNAGQWNSAQWNGDQHDAFTWTLNALGGHARGFRYDVATSDPGLVWQWGTWVVDAPAAWAQKPGSSQATLCVLDSGVATSHADIAPNLWTDLTGAHGANFIDPTRPPEDDAGHGTHIAGIAAGRIGNAYGIAGVSNARIMSVKVLDSTGSGLEDQLALGLVWCATHGAKVAVMALGVTEPGPTLDRALQFAADRDVLMLASSGNAGPCAACVGYPASDPRVLAVTALDGTGALASFASTGPEVDLAAPGVSILGPFLQNGFVFGSGTSQAVAYAAGVAALVRDAAPSLTAAQASSVLSTTAVPSGPNVRVVDANSAVALALAPQG